MKRIDPIAILLIIFIIICVGMCIFDTVLACMYWNKPLSEIPGWVLWFLFWL